MPTDNHGYNVPNEGDQDWHVPLNENFRQYDTDIEIRDEDGNRGDYDPKAGAKFLATDTGVVYVGDGSGWNATAALARYEDAEPQFAGNHVFGHPSNGVGDVVGATIAGGGFDDGSNPAPNEVTASYGTVSGGIGNVAGAGNTTVGGGRNNDASGYEATIAGGSNNGASSTNATVGGGGANTATAQYATVAGGRANDAEADYATVCGGENNTASAAGATVPGGTRNRAGGENSFAGGMEAWAKHDGTFIWSDESDDDFSSTAENQFLVGASGGIGLGTDDPQTRVDVAGGNNWNLDGSDGDVRIGDDNYRLAIGVALDGAGAGACTLRAKGGMERLNLGAGTSGHTIQIDPDAVSVNGDLDVSGNKNFTQTVDTDEGEKEVVYTASEAPTARTEVSGVARLEDGHAEIDLPEHFAWVTSEAEPLVVQVTPHASQPVRPQVTERSPDRLVVEEVGDGPGTYEVSYTVKGTRGGHEDKDVVREPGDGGTGAAAGTMEADD